MKKLAVILLTVAVCAVLCACTGDKKSDAKSLSDIWTDIKTQVTLTEMNELNERNLDRNYGITADMAEEFAGGINSSGTNQEEVVLVKATSEDNAAKIKELLDTRYASKLSQNKNYNAEQAKIIEKCKVEQNGLYVSMIVSENADKITSIFKDGAGI